MSTSPASSEARATAVVVTDDELVVSLADGRRIAVPLGWFPRLANATTRVRSNWVLLGGGVGIHWPDADEDVSVEGLLRGESSVFADR